MEPQFPAKDCGSQLPQYATFRTTHPVAVLHYLNHHLGPAGASTTATWLEPARHAALTRRLVTLALGQGRTSLAVWLADRRCRLAVLPEPIDLVLRAQALRLAGEPAQAALDVAEALAIDPDDVPANRFLLAWHTDPIAGAAAAMRLVELDRDPAIVASALALLGRTGTRAVARASMIDGLIRGWVAWRSPAPPLEGAAGDGGQTIVLEHGDAIHRLRLQPDPRHPLAKALGAANSFAVASRVEHGQWLAARGDDGPLLLTRAFTGFANAVPSRQVERKRDEGTSTRLTVIVPVFADLAATRVCLDSLLRAVAQETMPIEIIVVDDASPEPGMADYLAGLPVTLISNSKNLGFVASVNAALAKVEDSDVVLLNADTVVPAGALGRLAAIAARSDDIGTITPLSNNGELTSLPRPFRENPLPDADTIARIDAIARDIAGDSPVVVDLPAGIGFCLYVTRACLAAVGGLANRYERGYGEDVHLSLAAREAGLRNVCATSVYVGHVGTRSFGAEKRRLVMRNAVRVAARFPDHEREVAAFVAADPLAPVRHAIGLRLLDGFRGDIIVAGRSSRSQAEAHLQSLATDRRPAMLAAFERGVATWNAYDDDGALSASIRFNLPDELEQLADCRRRLQGTHMAVFSVEAFDAMGFDELDVPFDLHVCDAGGIARRGDRRPRRKLSAQWQRAIAGAGRIVAPNAAAMAFADALLKPAPGKLIAAPQPARPPASKPSQATRRLGVVLIDETAACRGLLRAIAVRLPRAADHAPSLMVMGRTGDDFGLLRDGGVMITGAVEAAEIATIARRYAITHVLALSSAANFGSPMADPLDRLDLPLAQFDWSGNGKPGTPDLAIPPDLDDDEAADAITHWMATQDKPR